MSTLQQISQRDPQWSLEAFVDIANALLPQFLPASESRRSVEAINPRLVRHYTTQSLIDKPLKEGREARYTYRHLLQLLVVRRLLAEGLSASAVQTLMETKPNPELEALLQGGIQLTVETANPALAFLQQVKQRSQPAAAPSAFAPAVARSPQRLGDSAAPTQWIRLEIVSGLEIQVRQDFAYPVSLQERENLLQLIAQRLADLAP
ncbi:MerR family transcriptional regulator [Almyronema epifaneia]|uniref:MerR family transcriptional regulator n=1 Tax=Almyronema epifaneia S1 TaxID=2991925 RepID=A0ABW6IBX7_9CYAN